MLLLALGGVAMAWPLLARRGGRSDVKRRLKVETAVAASPVSEAPKKKQRAVREKAMKTAHDFYAKSDPENVARLRMRLIQAGHMDPSAVGKFFLIRFVGLCRRRGRRIPGGSVDGRRFHRDESLEPSSSWPEAPDISFRGWR